MNRTETAPQGGTDERNGPPATSLRERVQSLRLRGGPGARPRGALLPWGVAVVALLTAAAFGWRTYRLTPAGSGADPSRAAAAAGGDRSAAPASAADAVAARETVLESKGYVIASHQIQVSPEASGKLIWINPAFEEGAHFDEGELLAMVDPVQYRARRDRVKFLLVEAEWVLANLEHGSRKQEIRQAEANLMSADAEVKRLRDSLTIIIKAADSAKPEERIDTEGRCAKAQADRQAAQEALNMLRTRTPYDIDQARARVNQARSDLADAEKQLQYCDIYAPVSGTILTKKAEFGNYVNPVGFNVAASLCEMADLREIEIELDVQERDLPLIVAPRKENYPLAPLLGLGAAGGDVLGAASALGVGVVEVRRSGQRVLVMPEAFQRDPRFLANHPHGYVGEVSRLMPTANRAKGAVPVRVRVKVPEIEAGVYLKPDMGALVSFKRAGW
jgi:multidrug efflux pump subunit AcrA (membrane-fusion protein)